MITIYSLLTLFSITASPLDGLNPEQPICYGREYSRQHMDAHPLQTVKMLKLKFYQDEYTNGSNALLDIKAEIKRWKKDSEGQPYFLYKPYSTGMFCQLRNNRLECAIECDGGSAKVAWNMSRNNNEILFKNEGFVMVGGCGDEEDEMIWLDPKRGGDDVFRLYALPKEFCQI